MSCGIALLSTCRPARTRVVTEVGFGTRECIRSDTVALLPRADGRAGRGHVRCGREGARSRGTQRWRDCNKASPARRFCALLPPTSTPSKRAEPGQPLRPRLGGLQQVSRSRWQRVLTCAWLVAGEKLQNVCEAGDCTSEQLETSFHRVVERGAAMARVLAKSQVWFDPLQPRGYNVAVLRCQKRRYLVTGSDSRCSIADNATPNDVLPADSNVPTGHDACFCRRCSSHRRTWPLRWSMLRVATCSSTSVATSRTAGCWRTRPGGYSSSLLSAWTTATARCAQPRSVGANIEPRQGLINWLYMRNKAGTCSSMHRAVPHSLHLFESRRRRRACDYRSEAMPFGPEVFQAVDLAQPHEPSHAHSRPALCRVWRTAI